MRTHAPTRRSSEPRVPKAVAQQIFERLNRDGTLDVVLNVLRDRYDHHAELAQKALGAEIITDAPALARFQARQGALGELQAIVTMFGVLGARQRTAQDE